MKIRGHFSLKKKILIVILVIVLLVLVEIFILYRINDDKQGPDVTTEPEQVDISGPDHPTRGTLLDKATNNETEYWFEVLRYNEIEDELLKKWMDNSLSAVTDDDGDPVYYSLYNNSSDNLDVYLYMPDAKQIMGDVILSSIRVTEANTALIIYIETNSNTTYNKESRDLILHIQATSDTTKAKTDKLIIDGATYYCANATFTALP